MSGRERICTGLATLLIGVAFCLRGSAQPADNSGETCQNQSPRKLEKYEARLEKPSVVRPGEGNTTITYTPPGGQATTLHRCGQHYHCRIENLQPECPGQIAKEVGTPPLCGQPPDDGWIEIHTVYSPRVRHDGCDPESLNCCLDSPVVVVAYHARVKPGAVTVPVPVQWGPPVAEWSGSNTGPDDFPGACKPVQARWSFTLGCDFKVTWGQLKAFHHPEPARGLQPQERLSSDLARFPPPPMH
jgi:hypothetical protein